MTTVIGGTTVRDPDSPLEMYTVFVGRQDEAHDGTLLTSYTAEKRGWRLKWTLLTSSQYSTLLTPAYSRASQTFSPPYTTATYSVVVKAETVKEDVNYGASNYYSISFDIEEVS